MCPRAASYNTLVSNSLPCVRWLVVSPENHSPDQSTSIRVRFGMRVPVEEGVAAALPYRHHAAAQAPSARISPWCEAAAGPVATN